MWKLDVKTVLWLWRGFVQSEKTVTWAWRLCMYKQGHKGNININIYQAQRNKK